MKNPATLFNEEHAAAYDARFARLAPTREALHLLTQIILSDLPADSRVLCVGAGTGAELLALAQAFPHFTFKAVEPSEPMLAVCRKRAEAAGVADRCKFHHGYLSELEETPEFDVALSLLVSQFLVVREQRIAFFADIACRLKPGGRLISADLSADLDSPSTDDMKTFWRQMLAFTGLPPEQTENYLKAWRADVAVLPPDEVEKIISSGGFQAPTEFYRSLFIRAWHARRSD